MLIKISNETGGNSTCEGHFARLYVEKVVDQVGLSLCLKREEERICGEKVG